MKYLLLTCFAFFSVLMVNGQQLNITDPDYTQSNPIVCANYTDGGAINFFDDGGAGADYSGTFTETFTICPDVTNGMPKVTISIATNAGYSWDVDGTDTLYIFDGPDATAPLLGAYNSNNSPNGFNHTSSWGNPSGCLTFVFVSDGATEGTGWGGNITCSSPAQPFVPHIEAFINGSPGNDMAPVDTGYVDICQGDSVLLVAKPDFPFASENTGTGYSQNLTNVDYLWEFSNGAVGPNNDSIWFSPAAAAGFYVSLKITDNFPQIIPTFCKIRVSQTPSFEGTGPLEDTVCFEQETNLLGGTNTTDTVGVDFPEGSFEIGGSFAGLTWLPDGSGAQYTTDIAISGFPPGTVLNNSSDLQDICVTMEHSYLGDLEMWIECPNGSEAALFNGYSGGYLPGGFGGGNTYLGEPIDNDTGSPGNGYEYCFSSVNNTFGTFTNEYTTNTIPTPPGAPSAGNTMDPNGIYTPGDDFSTLAGCPLNGNWTIHVQDNIGIDDGYIFEWAIYFDPQLYPENEFYQTTITDSYWSQAPSIISDTTNDTLITVLPNGPGNYDYIFNVVDDYGCAYDTTITIHVLDTTLTVNSLDTTIFCPADSIPLWTEATGLDPLTYTWEDSQDSTTVFHGVDENGTYEYIVTVKDACGIETKDTASITMDQTLAVDTTIQYPTECGEQTGSVSGSGTGFTGTPDYVWYGPGNDTTNINASVFQNLGSGWYHFTIEDDVCKVEDSIFLEQEPPPEASFTADPEIGPSPLNVTFTNTSDPATTYNWDFGNGETNSVPDLSDQNSTYIDMGTYTVTLTTIKGGCSDQATKIITVVFPLIYDMPNIFTPNGDSENDFFTINAENVADLDVVITNRWGNVVFESTDVNFEWNGKKDNSGPECTDGTYFYKFNLKGISGEEAEEHGFVQLVRGK